MRRDDVLIAHRRETSLLRGASCGAVAANPLFNAINTLAQERAYAWCGMGPAAVGESFAWVETRSAHLGRLSHAVGNGPPP
jgi:hypothetical protein